MLIPNLRAANAALPILNFPVVVVGVKGGNPYTTARCDNELKFREFSFMVLGESTNTHLLVVSTIGGTPFAY